MIQGNVVKEIFNDTCYGSKHIQLPISIFTCIEAFHLDTGNQNKIYSDIVHNLKKKFQRLPFTIHDCLYNEISTFYNLVASLNIHFNKCVKNQDHNERNCSDDPFHFHDSSNQAELNLKIEILVMDIIDKALTFT